MGKKSKKSSVEDEAKMWYPLALGNEPFQVVLNEPTPGLEAKKIGSLGFKVNPIKPVCDASSEKQPKTKKGKLQVRSANEASQQETKPTHPQKASIEPIDNNNVQKSIPKKSEKVVLLRRPKPPVQLNKKQSRKVGLESIDDYRLESIDHVYHPKSQPEPTTENLELLQGNQAESNYVDYLSSLMHPEESIKANKNRKNCEIPEEIEKVLEHSLKPWKDMTNDDTCILREFKELLKGGLTKSNYIDYLSFLLYAEEYQMEKDILQLDMQLYVTRKCDYYKIMVPGVQCKLPLVVFGSSIYLSKNNSEDKEFELTVSTLYQNEVWLQLADPSQKSCFNQKIYGGGDAKKSMCFARFAANPSVLKSMHRSLGMLSRLDINRFFPNTQSLATKPAINKLKFFNTSIGLAEPQAQAVGHIVAGSSGVYPYLLIGSPGTGKTAVLIEAVKQVWKTDANARIIVATPSNSSVDQIAQKLLETVPEGKIVRLNASYRERAPDLSSINKFVNMQIKDVKKYKIFCLTLAMCSHLRKLVKEPGYFTHVFIDDANLASEPHLVLATGGLINPKSQIILSGDPHPLGPCVASRIADKHGLSISPIERLKQFPLYCEQPKGGFNPSVITKLDINFRSHPALLEITNQLLCETKLKSGAPHKNLKPEKFNFLPNPEFPMLFHSVRSIHKRDKLFPSFSNRKEIEIVVNYVRKLQNCKVSMKDIGIIAPYKKQTCLIKAAIQAIPQSGHVLIGTIEEFQGRERPVIILSTVRSSLTHEGTATLDVGFLRLKTRFQMALTRAQSMQIIIGDPFLLRSDKTWNHLLQYCLDKGAMVGCAFNNEKAVEFYSQENLRVRGLKKKPKQKKKKNVEVGPQGEASSGLASAKGDLNENI